MRDCPPGYFCESGTAQYLDSPCEAGTYRPNPRATSQGDCSNCPAGFYCLAEVAEPIACPAGTYHDTGAADAADLSKGSNPCKACTEGSMCPYSGMSTPLPCGEGFYSQLGAKECTICQAGYQCSGTTQGATAYELDSNKCDGYKCELWFNNIYEKHDCDEGHYCPADSNLQVPCPRGTYRDNPAGSPPVDVTHCLDATQGYYSDREGMTSAMLAENLCAAGYKCPTGSRSKFQVACPPGSYQPSEGQYECLNCPIGNFCLGATIHPIPCTAGFYCPEGDASDPEAATNFPQPCPKGTYGALTGLQTVDQCQDCDAGFFCAETGADSPTGMCDAGYYCILASTVPRPTDGIVGSICPAGGYCEKGSAWPKYCQGGYYNPYEGKQTIFDCTLCPPGEYCDGSSSGSVNSSGNCDDGYYCLAGSPISNQYPAPPGTISNSDTEWKATSDCPQTQYNNLWHQATCFDCPQGFYCRTLGITDNFTPCPVGYYCPTGVKDPIICPQGTYNPTPNAYEATQCLECPPGKYCASQGLENPTGDCAPGYFCSRRVIDREPAELED